MTTITCRRRAARALAKASRNPTKASAYRIIADQWMSCAAMLRQTDANRRALEA